MMAAGFVACMVGGHSTEVVGLVGGSKLENLSLGHSLLRSLALPGCLNKAALLYGKASSFFLV
jgi:hypothetical protein